MEKLFTLYRQECLLEGDDAGLDAGVGVSAVKTARIWCCLMQPTGPTFNAIHHTAKVRIKSFRGARESFSFVRVCI